MGGKAVTFVADGGIPVTEVATGGIPVSEVALGGLPLTLVGSGGQPVATDGGSYAANGSNPAYVADFLNGRYRKDGATAAGFSDVVSFSRASTATYVDSEGTLHTAAANVARTNHHKYVSGAWVNKGLLHESDAATNLFLNSGTLATQGVTVTAQAYTVHFTGTGTITFSGAHTGSLVGVGTGENNRVSVTFTPTAGTVTCTVSGTVTNAQFEAGSIPTSYISTAGSTATRAAETLIGLAADLPWNASGVSLVFHGEPNYADVGAFETAIFLRWRLSGTEFIQQDLSTNGANTGRIYAAQYDGTNYDPVSDNVYSPGLNVPIKIASHHSPSLINGSADGSAFAENSTPAGFPDLSATDLLIGHKFNGTIERVLVFGTAILDAGTNEATS